MTAKQMRTILEICAALSAERDREALLSRILDAAMDLTRCDGGTLYLLGPDGLHFCRMVTRSLGVRQGGHDAPITLPPVPLSASHVCARAVLENRLINVPDVYKSRSFDFSGARRYDAMTGYRTRSVLVAPLTDDRGGLIGVLQLINALTADGRPARFTPGMEPLVTALAAQAAISLTNMQYSEQIAALLDSLVGALSAAIDQRTPYNASHTRSMVKYAVRFLDWLDRTGDPRRFDPDRRRAFLLSVWLHDVGKLTVPLEVMDKADRLGPALERIERRFTEMELLDRIALLEGRLDGPERSARAARRAEALERIRRDNTAGFLPDEEIAALERSKTITAKLWASGIAILGTAFMAGSVFAVTAKPPNIMLCVLLAVPAFAGWVAPWFVYRFVREKKTKQVTPFIETKMEELYTLCEKGNTLL